MPIIISLESDNICKPSLSPFELHILVLKYGDYSEIETLTNQNRQVSEWHYEK